MRMLCDSVQEDKLIERMLAGDETARNTLMMLYQPFIHTMAMRICFVRSAHEDLIQSGNIGLCEAVEHFCPSCGVRLMTYAWPWILGEMKKTLHIFNKEAWAVSLDTEADSNGRPLQEVLTGLADIDTDRIDLRTAIMALCEEERLVICLRYYRDKSQKETALLLKKSQSQISKLERKILDKLSVMLA